MKMQKSLHEAAKETSIEPSLAGKTALVTGSTSGIGLAIAQALAGAGMNIVLNGLSPKGDIDHIRRRLWETTGASTAYSPADLSHSDGVAKMIDKAREAFGGVDVLVNNAGIQHVAAIESFPIAKWESILALSLTAPFLSIRAVLPEMKERKWGRIINMASAHGLVASPYKSAYVAAKHGLLGLTKTVALEAAEDGVTVNAICPGYVLTPLVQDQIPETAKARGLTEDQVVRDVLLQAQPTRRFVTVEQVAALALFLCTPGADSITGTALPIEGGWTAR